MYEILFVLIPYILVYVLVLLYQVIKRRRHITNSAVISASVIKCNRYRDFEDRNKPEHERHYAYHTTLEYVYEGHTYRQGVNFKIKEGRRIAIYVDRRNPNKIQCRELQYTNIYYMSIGLGLVTIFLVMVFILSSITGMK